MGEMDFIIQSCDEAFRSVVSKRKNYPKLLAKIFTKGKMLVMYQKEIVGYCAFYANDLQSRAGYISLIAIKRMYQNNHIGAKLLDSCLEEMRLYGMKCCLLEVKKHNISAVRFYEANGFSLNRENQESYFMRRVL